MTRVRVAVISRIIAAGYLDANPMSFEKQHAGRPEIDMDFSSRVRFNCAVCREILTTENPIRDVIGRSIRMNVHQLAREIRIGSWSIHTGPSISVQLPQDSLQEAP